MIKFTQNIKWKIKYNRLCVLYEELANKKICELENYNNILLKNIEYRDLIDDLKDEVKIYRRKYGRLEGGDKIDKNKNKR